MNFVLDGISIVIGYSVFFLVVRKPLVRPGVPKSFSDESIKV